ncbi:hypothetical protein H072_6417 [Dactylellina haptotyla CBS 200.50]|uniref:Lysine-specific metallo-endopeptidase domain-containing protein n=1 Tax=Dactylellina haptotyla (strain CBS 200.50) TaxID=1284197 RepID=S8BXD9_DACHA|nr:hypothetical protein H072_6417 [Dactylellina haptotyla CBS 200.50]
MFQLHTLVLLAFSTAKVFAGLKDKLDYPDGLSGLFDIGFANLTDSPLDTMDQWGDGWIPQGCKDRFLASGYSAKDAQVFNVKYLDCDRAWTFCRHNKAELSIDDMAMYFGKMPVHMRSLVRHPIALPQPEGCSAQAFTDIGDIVMYGPCNASSVWVHETGHQLDSRLNSATRFSATPEWTDALGYDSCVPDNYANTNVLEDFAQVVVIAAFNTLAGYKPPEAFKGCLDHRQGLLEENFRGTHFSYWGTCDNRPDDSPIVSKASTKRDIRRTMNRANLTDDSNPAVVGPCFFDLK